MPFDCALQVILKPGEEHSAAKRPSNPAALWRNDYTLAGVFKGVAFNPGRRSRLGSMRPNVSR